MRPLGRIDAALEFANIGKDLVESRRISKEHFLHLLIISTEFTLKFGAGRDPQRSGFRQIIPRRRFAEKDGLVLHDLIQEFEIRDRPAADLMAVQP